MPAFRYKAVAPSGEVLQGQMDADSLDDVIARMSEDPVTNQLQLQRLKKRKLLLKDQIACLRSQILPDIIA